MRQLYKLVNWVLKTHYINFLFWPRPLSEADEESWSEKHCLLLVGMHCNMVTIIPHTYHQTLQGFDEFCSVWALFSSDLKTDSGPEVWWRLSNLLFVVLQNDCIGDHVPLAGQAIPVAEIHGEFIRTRWPALPYKLSRVKKHWAGFSQAYFWGNRERPVHPFPFLALPRHVNEEPSQKHQTCSGFWTGSDSNSVVITNGKKVCGREEGGCQAE